MVTWSGMPPLRAKQLDTSSPRIAVIAEFIVAPGLQVLFILPLEGHVQTSISVCSKFDYGSTLLKTNALDRQVR